MIKNNNSNIKIKFNIFRIIAFVVIYGIFGVLLFTYLRSYICIVFLLTFLIVPFLSIVLFYVLIQNFTIKLNIYNSEVYVNDEINGHITIDNNSFFTALKCTNYINLENIYFNEFDTINYLIPIVAKSIDKHPIIFKCKNCGLYTISLKRCEIKDICGFVKAYINIDNQYEIIALPGKRILDEIDRINLIEGYCDNEDTTIKGNDYSDVSEIREYVPGDRIKDIHWKLSAKKDLLMVKDRIKSSENKLVIWIDSSTDKRVCENIFSYALAVIDNAVKENVVIKLLWYNYVSNNVCEYVISQNNQIKDFIKRFYKSGTGKNIDNIDSVLADNDIYEDYIRVGKYDSQIGLDLNEKIIN